MLCPQHTIVAIFCIFATNFNRVKTMKKTLLTLLCCCSIVCGWSGYSTQILSTDINTLLVHPAGAPLLPPIIKLGSEDVVRITFDEMSYGNRNYNYKLVHCNADWEPSVLMEQEYMRGFGTGSIDDAEQSRNTTVLYTNYQFFIPNESLTLTASGNYAVLIAENDDFEHPVAVACFCVAEPRITIEGTITGNTLQGINSHWQQLSFDVIHKDYNIRDPLSELTVQVYQNRRTDNAVTNLKPTYSTPGRQSYTNNRALTFEGGNEYRTIDFSSEYTYGSGIEHIVAHDNVLHAELIPSEPRATQATPPTGGDADGRMRINRQNAEDSDTEADYVWVHFTLPIKPLRNGDVYLIGDLVGNRFDYNSRMDYNSQTNSYQKALLLKQGGYSFLYAIRANSNAATTLPIEGSYWETENEYLILVYQREWGGRYDRLIGYRTLYSNNKEYH